MALLEVSGLSTTFYTRNGIVKAVDDVSFSVDAGETLAIVGESGSGKSVCCYSLLGLIPCPPGRIESGTALFDGQDLLALNERELRRIRGSKIATIFQDPMTSLNPYLTVGEQLIEPLIYHKKTSRKAARVQAIALLDEVGIPQAPRRFDNYPHQFSGGMRQRVMIAMALIAEPQLLIADEPTTALDVTIQAQTLKLISQLQSQRNLAVIFISHDLAVVSQIANKVVVMKDGVFVESGSTSDIFNHPQHIYTQTLLAAVPSGAKARRTKTGSTKTGSTKTGSTKVDATKANTTKTKNESAEDKSLIKQGSISKQINMSTQINTPKESYPAKGVRSPLLEISHLKTWFNGPKQKAQENIVKAVDDVSLSIQQGEILGIVGESGSGKSTLGRSILQLVKTTEGSIKFAGEELTTLNTRALRPYRRRMQMIFQDPYASLNPRMTVLDTLAEPLLCHGLAKRKTVLPQVLAIMDDVGLAVSSIRKYPHEFSGGQRQRIAIGRAIATRPELIVADEPVSALDVTIQAQILELILELVDKHALTMLFISHDLSVVRYICDRVAVMCDGKLIETGDTETLWHQPQQAYTQALLKAIPSIAVADV